MSIIFGILAGIGVPIQTSINARLRKKVGSPYLGHRLYLLQFH